MAWQNTRIPHIQVARGDAHLHPLCWTFSRIWKGRDNPIKKVKRWQNSPLRLQDPGPGGPSSHSENRKSEAAALGNMPRNCDYRWNNACYPI